mgnify:FL=1
MKNKVWIEQVRDELKSDFETEILYYDHWDKGVEEMDFPAEEVKLKKMCQGEYVILSKSAGSWLALKLVAEGKVKPRKLILVGPAWSWAKNNGFDPSELIRKVDIPILIVDKTADPAISFADLKKEVDALNKPNIRLVEVPGDTHHYEDVIGLGKIVREFV